MAKVLHIIDHPGLGGAQRLVETILNHRQDDRLLALRSKTPHLIDLPAHRYLMPTKHLGIRSIMDIFRLPGQIQAQHIQVVHCHLTVSWVVGYWLAKVIPKRQGVQFLFHAHDSENIHQQGFRWLSRMVSRVGRIIVVSKFIQAQFIASGIPEDRLFQLYNFIDLNRLQNGKKSSLDLDPEWVGENKLIGFAGRLTENKGLAYLVKAMHILRDEPVKFLIAGIGPFRNELDQLIRKYELGDKVRLFGFLHELPDLFHTVDAFASPSLVESFGLVHLEAQASGRVVVAFDIEAIRETIGAENALLAEKGNSRDLAQCILRAVQDEALRGRLTHQGLENAKRFSITHHLERLGNLYGTIIEEG